MVNLKLLDDLQGDLSREERKTLCGEAQKLLDDKDILKENDFVLAAQIYNRLGKYFDYVQQMNTWPSGITAYMDKLEINFYI